MDTKDFLGYIEDTFNGCLAIASAKNADYAAEGDPFKNFRMVEQSGICSTEKGILVRLSDKMSRIANLIEGDGGAVKDESVEDTINDAINYLAILKAYRSSKRGQ